MLETGTGNAPRCPGIPSLVASRAVPCPALPSPPATATAHNKAVKKLPCATSLWEGLTRAPRRCHHVPGHGCRWVGRWGATPCPHPDDALSPAAVQTPPAPVQTWGWRCPWPLKAPGCPEAEPCRQPGTRAGFIGVTNAPHPGLGHASTQPRVKVGAPGPLLSVPTGHAVRWLWLPGLAVARQDGEGVGDHKEPGWEHGCGSAPASIRCPLSGLRDGACRGTGSHPGPGGALCR